MKHQKFDYILTVVKSGMPVLLVGTAGTGKSTLSQQMAQELDLSFHAMSCTKQMSVNSLLGFISINGVYIPTQFRKAFEEGGVFLLDEIDAADPNVLLALNTIENGYISFPDGVVQKHPDFRLIATANPFHAHNTYTGRSKLDFSTINRYFIVELELDQQMELQLTSQEVVDGINIARDLFTSHGITTELTMRDTIRLHQLNSLGISDCIYHDVIFKHHPYLYETFNQKFTILKAEAQKASMTQSAATTVDDLWDVVSRTQQVDKARSDLVNTSSTQTVWKPNTGIAPVVPNDYLVEVKFRSGEIDTDKPENYRWTLTDNSNDILEYHTVLDPDIIPF